MAEDLNITCPQRAIDTANNRIWAEVASSATTRWRYATLTAV